MRLTSPSFEPNAEIPRQFTCQGEDVSPELSFGDVPAGTRSLALTVDDPDAPDPAAPKKIFSHWVVYGLPPTTEGLPQNVTAASLPKGAAFGRNDWGNAEWGGPCPPIGRHRYFFVLYALDVELSGLEAPTRDELRAAMEGHVLGQVELVGTYEKR
jgi:Raf kinase inhibitor-like YbhB/YbcL family protein